MLSFSEITISCWHFVANLISKSYLEKVIYFSLKSRGYCVILKRQVPPGAVTFPAYRPSGSPFRSYWASCHLYPEGYYSLCFVLISSSYSNSEKVLSLFYSVLLSRKTVSKVRFVIYSNRPQPSKGFFVCDIPAKFLFFKA